MRKTTVATINTYCKTRAILLNHIGRSNPISSAEVSNILGVPDDNGTRSVTRKIIRETAKYYSLPILSCKYGYYLASNADELADYNKNIEMRINSMKERMENVNENYVEYMEWYEKGVAYGILA